MLKKKKISFLNNVCTYKCIYLVAALSHACKVSTGGIESADASIVRLVKVFSIFLKPLLPPGSSLCSMEEPRLRSPEIGFDCADLRTTIAVYFNAKRNGKLIKI